MNRTVFRFVSAVNLIRLIFLASALCYVLCDSVDRPPAAVDAKLAAEHEEEDSRGQNSLMDEMQVIIPTERPVTIPPSEVINPPQHKIGKNKEIHVRRTDNRRDGTDATDESTNGNLSFFHGFLASLSVILVSELGDKTFFIAAIMAMRHSRVTVFTGAIAALALMTVLSAVFGMAANLIPKVYTYYISTILFVIFGLKMLRDGLRMSEAEAQEEFEEVQLDLKKREDEYDNRIKASDLEASPSTDALNGRMPLFATRSSNLRIICCCLFPGHILIQSFTMTFLAEWGDRSQLTTIILAARENVVGVIIGGILGHSLCTGLAVIGGRMIAQRISVKTVTIVGGVVFLLFALSALIFNNPHED